jgi:hypothetical protein
MKFIFCTCNVSMLERVIGLLEANEVNDYQVTDKIITRSVKGAPRFDTAVWPGYNVNITMQITDNTKSATILNLLRNYNNDNGSNDDELLTVCSWEMDNYFFD